LRVVVDAPAPTDWSLPASAAAASIPQRPLSALVRRVALWGAGPQGEYLAWRSVAPAVVAPAPHTAVRSPVGRPSLLTSLVRRGAFWGAGRQGEHLAGS